MEETNETLCIGIDLGPSRSSISASNGERHVVDSYVGWPLDMVARKLVKKTVLIGREALDNRSMLDLHRPLERGVIKELGGQLVGTGPEHRQNLDVIAGWVSMATAPEYSYWLEIAQKYDLEFLELPKDLMENWAREGNYSIRNSPAGLLRGVGSPRQARGKGRSSAEVPTQARTGWPDGGRWRCGDVPLAGPGPPARRR